MSFEIGDTVGTYRILEKLGSGGMGEVFKVEHAITGRVEAMKILAPDTSSTPEQQQRFLREIQLQAGLSHPNIAAVHNAFRENGHLVMIMELIEGRSLGELLKAGKLPLEISIDYARQALAALEYAHANGVVHRDISPANMIVSVDGTLKLMDFGLAKSRTDVRLTETGALVGSLHYTSPEQVKGSRTVDARSDIYSLGAVLYEMTTGRKLFHSENPFTLMLAHVEQPPEPPSEVNPELPRALDEILLKALEKDPEKRFRSAELFRRGLEQVKEGQDRVAAIRAAAASEGGPNSGWIRRSPALPLAAALLLAVLLTWIWRGTLVPLAYRWHRTAAVEARDATQATEQPAPASQTAHRAEQPAPASQTAHRAEEPAPSSHTAHRAEEPGGTPDGQPETASARDQRKPEARKHNNPFRRALTWVAHPFHRTNDHAAAPSPAQP